MAGEKSKKILAFANQIRWILGDFVENDNSMFHDGDKNYL